MSSWSPNTKTTSHTAGMGPLYTMGVTHNKQLLNVGDERISHNKLPPSKSFSTATFGFVSSFFAKFASILVPSEAQTNTLERKQSVSTPDICVDISISTPIFETGHGKTKLTIPDDEATTCDLTKSLSVGNSPYDWCPIKEELDKITLKETLSLRPTKRAKVVNTGYSIATKDSCVKMRRPFNKIQVHNKMKPGNKNRNEKNRHNLLIEMMEDYREITDDSDVDSETELSEPNPNDGYEVIPNNCLIPSTTNVEVFLSLSEEAFPKICPVNSEITVDDNSSGKDTDSECESEDSFVTFSEDVQLTTPSASPARRKDVCAAINCFFIPAVSRRLQQQRQISECSDDSIEFRYDNDYEKTVCQLETSLDSDEDEEESEDEHQPDSGFEEKKVRFNLKADVHVMRMWDFAYRQARKGEWEMAARDRERFKKRIEDTEQILKPVFEQELRGRVYHERFSS